MTGKGVPFAFLFADELLLLFLDFVVVGIFRQNEDLLRLVDALLKADRSTMRFVLSCVRSRDDKEENM